MSKVLTFRFAPHDDLYQSLRKVVAENNLKAASVIAAAGSLEVVALRFANQKETTLIEGKHEILSLSGTMSDAGLHVHLSVSDGTGKVTGGHLKPGSKIYTTAEIVIMESSDEVYNRVLDETYGYKELKVSKR